MNIEAMRYFIELARTGSFYGASKRLFISQQGLNKAISGMEAELGVKLVERSRRGVRLTNAGEIFLEHAEAIQGEYFDMLDDLYAENFFATNKDPRLVFHLTYYPAQISRPFIEGLDAIDVVSIVEEPFPQLLDRAAESDGSELFMIDVYDAKRREAFDDRLVFEPIVVSQFGVVWKEGSPLASYRAIHREQIANYPLAVDSHREMLKLVHTVMEDYPLNNIRMGMAEPRTTLEYANTSDQVASTFDSFGFMLAQNSPSIATDGLHFTPFSTPRSMCRVGFVYAKTAKPNVRARHAIDTLKRFIAETYPDYFARYPID